MNWARFSIIVLVLGSHALGQSTTQPSAAWAEMVQDRKFALAVSDEPKGSPWKPIGIPGMVSMDKEFPYVGKQALAVQIPGSGAETGVSQAGLKVTKGIKYTGRIVLAADEGVAPVVVQLSLHDGQMLTQRIEQVGTDYKAYPLEFTAPITSNDVRLEIISNAGPGVLRVGAVSLMPADQVKGFQAQAVAKLKESKATSFEWKLSPWDWKTGLDKDRDRRAPEASQNAGVEPHDVGIHEFMDLMSLIGTEAVIVADKDADALREYVAGSADTPMGKLRGANGHVAPWTNVRVRD